MSITCYRSCRHKKRTYLSKVQKWQEGSHCFTKCVPNNDSVNVREIHISLNIELDVIQPDPQEPFDQAPVLEGLQKEQEVDEFHELDHLQHPFEFLCQLELLEEIRPEDGQHHIPNLLTAGDQVAAIEPKIQILDEVARSPVLAADSELVKSEIENESEFVFVLHFVLLREVIKDF